MTVTTVASVAAGVVQRNLSTSRSNIAQSVKTLLSARPDAATSQLKMSEAVALQTQSSGLRQASLTIARTASQVSAADAGASTIQRTLVRMNQLAERAADPSATADTRSALNEEFQSLRANIQKTVASTRFENASLLDGSVNARDLGLESDDPNAGLPNLSEAALFGGVSLSLADAAGATAAAGVVSGAITFVVDARNDLQSFEEALNQGGATIESALQNLEASRSNFGEEDFKNGMSLSIANILQNDVQLSAEAQTRLMPANIVLLIAE